MLDSILNIDTNLFLAMNGSWGTGWDTFFYWMSDKFIWVPLYLIILGAVYRRYGWKTTIAFLVFLALAIIVADQICNIAKDGFKKLRPTHDPEIQYLVHTVRGYRGGLYGTFSAHAATTSCIALFSSRIFHNIGFTIFIWLWAATIWYSRIYLGVHFPLDILLGGTTGFLLGWWAFNLFQSSRFKRLYSFS